MSTNFGKETICSCNVCKAMCDRPCWDTPEEIQKIIDAGFGDKLMIDYWVSSPDILILCGATKGYEGKLAPLLPTSGCVFQTSEGFCELHDLGLKPIEGRVASCEEDSYDGYSLHGKVALTWKNKIARKLIKAWRSR